jgi:hypothetical protein
MTRRVDLAWLVLAVAAATLGIWLGVSGADVSPIFTEVPLGVGRGPGR